MEERYVEEPVNMFVIPRPELPALKFGVYKVSKIVHVGLESYYFLDGGKPGECFTPDNFFRCTRLFPYTGKSPVVGERYKARVHENLYCETSPVVELFSILGPDGKESFIFQTFSQHYYFGTNPECAVPEGAC